MLGLPCCSGGCCGLPASLGSLMRLYGLSVRSCSSLVFQALRRCSLVSLQGCKYLCGKVFLRLPGLEHTRVVCAGFLLCSSDMVSYVSFTPEGCKDELRMKGVAGQ